MKRLHSTLMLMLCFLIGLSHIDAYAQSAQKSTVVGTVVNARNQEALAYVQVMIKGTTLGTTTDVNGTFKISNIPSGTYTLVASSIGFETVEQRITLSDGQRRHLDLYMHETSIDLDGIVVSANRQETLRKLAPNLVTVLGGETFVKTHSENLSQGLRFQPGLRVEDNCQNCGFNQVRINGLEGAYSQILIDSRPVMSALAGVYGLEQIPASMIERVEVVRGGGSALFGSSAIGGVINIITREPLRSSASLSQTVTSYDRYKGSLGSLQSTTSFNGALVTDDHRAAVMIFGQHSARPGHDYDGDSFTELPELKNRSLGFRSYYKTGLYGKLTAEYRSMQEYRRGGDRLDRPPFEARIAEYLQHFINGGALRFDQGSRSGRHQLSLYASGQHVLRRSYYGGGDDTRELLDKAKTGDQSAFDESLAALTAYGITRGFDAQAGGTYIHRFPIKLDLTFGLEGTYSSLNDKSGFRRVDIDQIVKTLSQFTQLEYKTDAWTILLGGRVDHVRMTQAGKRAIHPLTIFSPRANVRFNPIKDLSLRLSYSEGFRAPQFFDEEMHVELAGGSPIARVLSPDLKEERSRSISASADWYTPLGNGWQLNLMGEGFYTTLRNQFIASPIEKEIGGIKQRIIINDSKGRAVVYGATFEAKIAWRTLFDLQGGVTIQRSRYGSPKVLVDADDKTKQVEIATQDYERTPNLYGYFTSTIRPTKHLTLNLSGTYTGSMNVLHEAYSGLASIPSQDARGHFDFVKDGQRYRGVAPGHAYLYKSKPFLDLDAKASYDFDLTQTVKLTLSAGVQNIFGAYQSDTDMGPGRASSYVYGPMLPRRIYMSATLNI